MQDPNNHDQWIDAICENAVGLVDAIRSAPGTIYTKDKELRIPVVVHGTDVRVTISAGPRVGANNALRMAQDSGSTPLITGHVAVPVILSNARVLIEGRAKGLKKSFFNEETASWTNSDAERIHAKCLDTIKGLGDVELIA